LRLFWSSRSPFVRKVMVCAHELGLAGRIECVPKLVTMLQPDDEVSSRNPLQQIPTLILDDGSSLYDSGVICDYLNGLVAGGELVPADPALRIDMARRQAEGDGLLDTFIRLYGQRRRADHPMTPQYVEADRRKLRRMLGHWEAAAPSWAGRPLDLGFVAIGCALCYADFRFAAEVWRTGHPQLAAWHVALCRRPSFRATEFRDA
jgi:glutathione S-transferase